MEIRPLDDDHVDAVLALNRESVTSLAPMDGEALGRYRMLTPLTRVCIIEDEVAAFAIAYPPGTAYDSVNYLWHADRFDDFLYLDRITVGSRFRRRGIATSLYDDMEQIAVAHARMVCEIYSDPPNNESIAFHLGRGYREVGHLRQTNGYECVMMEKPFLEMVL
jgi:predicted GNAT superfamily acetyltransferase